MTKRTPPKWTEVYPQGTKEGDEEQKFFIAIARNHKWDFRSVAAISKEIGLPEKRIEEIIQKYFKTGMIVQSPKNEDHWAYWERVPKLGEKDDASIAEKDQDMRISKATKKP